MDEPVWIPTWQEDATEIKSNNFLHQGFFKIQGMVLRHRCFSGEWSPWLQREQVSNKDAAAVLLVDLKQQKLVLVEQFRVGLVTRSKTSPWLLEVVAGLVEDNEAPEAAMVREVKEEANCDIQKWLKIGEYYNTPGGFTEKTSLFCAIVDATGKAGIQGASHEQEDIRVHVLPMQDVIDAMVSWKLQSSASTILALQWLAINLKNKHPFLVE